MAEGIPELAIHVRALVEAALAHDVVARASARPHWRESYIGTVEEDGTVLEGFVDLIFHEEDGKLTVVDYKTDHVRPEALKTRTTFYAPQVAAYERVLRAATDAPISSRLLFLGSTSEFPETGA